MKKHLLGLFVFSSIVIASVAIFAFFYKPPIPAVEVYELPSEKVKNSCDRTKKEAKISFEILSSNYFVDEGKIITKVKISQPLNAEKPERLDIYGSFSNSGRVGRESLLKVVENPFTNSDVRIVIIETDARTDSRPEDNLYVSLSVSEFGDQTENLGKFDLTQSKAVLFVHGKSSIMKK